GGRPRAATVTSGPLARGPDPAACGHAGPAASRAAVAGPKPVQPPAPRRQMPFPNRLRATIGIEYTGGDWIMHDRYRSRYRLAGATNRLRRQIALEAARRLYAALVPKGEEPPAGWLDTPSSSDFYLAKRKAAAVLGHRIRPGDLPSDDEVRELLCSIQRETLRRPDIRDDPPPREDQEESTAGVASLADHLDRFALYKMRLVPLESVKQ